MDEEILSKADVDQVVLRLSAGSDGLTDEALVAGTEKLVDLWESALADLALIRLFLDGSVDVRLGADGEPQVRKVT